MTEEPTAPDIDGLVDRLRENVARRRAEGLYPESLERDLDSHFARLSSHLPTRYDPSVLRSKLDGLNAQPGFTPARIESASGVPGGSAVHGMVARLVHRQVAGALAQVQDFADGVRSVLNEIVSMLEHPHGHSHADLLGQIESIHDRLTAYERSPEDNGVALQELSRRIDALSMEQSKRQFKPWFSNERFEEEFRGTPDEVRSRYVDLARLFTGCSPTVDLGCGRGEFLDLLAAEDVEAIGVEVDPRLVKSLVERGMRAEYTDAISWLRRAEDASLGGISMIQVIEHLTPQEVVDVVALARNKLRVGGKIVIETVNPQSLYVYARAFYADPTHENPVHPAYLTFLFKEAGFDEVDIDWRSPPPVDEILVTIADDAPAAASVNSNVERLNALLFGAQDYALIAVR